MKQKKSKKIVLINQVTGYLFIDVVNAFSEEYDEVILFSGVVKPMGVELSNKVKVVKIKKYNKSSTKTRIASWILGLIQIVYLLNIKYRKYEVLASSNPPTLNWLPLLTTNKASLLVYDVYPDGLIAGGFSKPGSLIVRFWSYLNKKSFDKFNSITTLTDGMSKLLTNYSEKQKIEVIPVWMNQEIEKLSIPKSENQFIKKYNLEDKFLIVYSGNLGKGYDLEKLVELSKSIQNFNKIKIIIIGEGYKRKELEELIKKLNVDNCLLLPYQPAELFKHVLSAMDVGVVALDPAAAQIAIPSKTFNIIAVGKPIISFSPKNSDLANLIEKDNFGKNFSEGNKIDLKSFLIKLFEDKKYYNELCQNTKISSKRYTFENSKDILKLHLNN